MSEIVRRIRSFDEKYPLTSGVIQFSSYIILLALGLSYVSNNLDLSELLKKPMDVAMIIGFPPAAYSACYIGDHAIYSEMVRKAIENLELNP